MVAELPPQDRSPFGRARPCWDVRHHYLDPDCLPDLLGGVEPDRFYWEHYTPEVITAWQRTGRPVPVTHDTLQVQRFVAALQLLESDGITGADLTPELLERVTSWLLHELSLRCTPHGRQMYERHGLKPDPAVRTTELDRLDHLCRATTRPPAPPSCPRIGTASPYATQNPSS